MPTGYTAEIESGEVTDFRTFALRCARAFGATIMQRDDPMKDPPKHREPTDYHAKQLEAAKMRSAELDAMTAEQAEVAANAEYERRLAEHRASVERRAVENGRYDAMAAEVIAWSPPTADHMRLRDFMLEQLRISRHDWTMEPPTLQTGEQWLKQQRESVLRDVGYHGKAHAEEVERCAGANRWIDALYDSLRETAPIPAPA